MQQWSQQNEEGKKEEFLKIKQTKKKEGEMNICWIQPTNHAI